VSETSSQPRTLRRVGAVLAGLLLVIITSTATDALMHGTGIFPPLGWPMPDSLFVLALAYRIVYSVAGGYLTARLAPDQPVKHALWLGIIGFIDDYLKLKAKRIAQEKGEKYKKGDKDGLAGWFKILGQVGLGIIVGATLYFNNSVKTWREYTGIRNTADTTQIVRQVNGKEKIFIETKVPVTTIPFVKNHEFNYSKLLPSAIREYTWVLYILVVIFIITAVSNGANITDGLDGLAAGTSALIGVCLGIFAYASGNFFFADYLNIMYIPNLGELSIFIAAMIGACVGFLWYNSYPAQVFMGDTGSLTLGGIIAAIAIIVHKELLIPIFCGVFLVELVSVMIQVSYFKYTKRKFGEGRRIFKMSPLHHHYQKEGYHEAKIVTRFWIVTVLCVVLSIVTLKLR